MVTARAFHPYHVTQLPDTLNVARSIYSRIATEALEQGGHAVLYFTLPSGAPLRVEMLISGIEIEVVIGDNLHTLRHP